MPAVLNHPKIQGIKTHKIQRLSFLLLSLVRRTRDFYVCEIHQNSINFIRKTTISHDIMKCEHLKKIGLTHRKSRFNHKRAQRSFSKIWWILSNFIIFLELVFLKSWFYHSLVIFCWYFLIRRIRLVAIISLTNWILLLAESINLNWIPLQSFIYEEIFSRKLRINVWKKIARLTHGIFNLKPRSFGVEKMSARLRLKRSESKMLSKKKN